MSTGLRVLVLGGTGVISAACAQRAVDARVDALMDDLVRQHGSRAGSR